MKNNRTIANDDEGAVAAANFAVDAQNKKAESGLKLLSIEKAQQQVVAGMRRGPSSYEVSSVAVRRCAKTLLFVSQYKLVSKTRTN